MWAAASLHSRSPPKVSWWVFWVNLRKLFFSSCNELFDWSALTHARDGICSAVTKPVAVRVEKVKVVGSQRTTVGADER